MLQIKCTDTTFLRSSDLLLLIIYIIDSLSMNINSLPWNYLCHFFIFLTVHVDSCLLINTKKHRNQLPLAVDFFDLDGLLDELAGKLSVQEEAVLKAVHNLGFDCRMMWVSS